MNKIIIYFIFLTILIISSGCAVFNHVSENNYISDENSNINSNKSWGWSFVDGNTEVGINLNPLKNAVDPVLIVYNSKLYASWSELNESGKKQIRIALYNNNDSSPSWKFVDNSILGSEPNLIVFDSKLYLITSYSNSSNLISTYVYNGNDNAPVWTAASNTSTGLNYNVDRIAKSPGLIVCNSKLYAAWMEDYNGSATLYNIRAAVYNGNDGSPSWKLVDGNNSYGLNKDYNQSVYNLDITQYNSKLYIIWDEENCIHSKVYNGNDNTPSWSFVEGTNNFLNKNPDVSQFGAKEPDFINFNSKLYAVWSEFYKRSDGGISSQIMTAVYNGDDSNPVWKYTDNNNPFGNNKDIKASSMYPKSAVFNSQLINIWQELPQGAYQIVASKYNGDDDSPNWPFITGDSTYGINRDLSKNGNAPNLVEYNSKLYATWEEGNSSPKQIRVAVYKQ